MDTRPRQITLIILFCCVYGTKGMVKMEATSNTKELSNGLRTTNKESISTTHQIISNNTLIHHTTNRGYIYTTLDEWMNGFGVIKDNLYHKIYREWQQVCNFGSDDDVKTILNEAINIIAKGDVKQYSTWYSIYLFGYADNYKRYKLDTNEINQKILHVYQKLNNNAQIPIDDCISCIYEAIRKYEDCL